MKFSIGDRVIQKESIRPHTSYTVDKVVGFLDDAVLVEHFAFGVEHEIHEDSPSEFTAPGSRGWREGLARYYEDELFTVEEAWAELARLEASKDALDKQFNSVRSSIKEKMEKAAEFVTEAAAIAKSCEKDFSDLKRECMPLYDAITEGGWRHSHMQC